jgi:hypothetical protein
MSDTNTDDELFDDSFYLWLEKRGIHFADNWAIAGMYPATINLNVLKSALQADRKKHELDARIDELTSLPVNWESAYDNNLKKYYSKVYDDVYNERLTKLKEEREKL